MRLNNYNKREGLNMRKSKFEFDDVYPVIKEIEHGFTEYDRRETNKGISYALYGSLSQFLHWCFHLNLKVNKIYDNLCYAQNKDVRLDYMDGTIILLLKTNRVQQFSGV